MTIEREYFDGPITFICDACGEADETRCTKFSGAIAKFRSHGGGAFKDDATGEWEHYCRSCQP